MIRGRLHPAVIRTSAGDFRAVFSSRGLAQLQFPSSPPPAPDDDIEQSASAQIAAWKRLTQEALESSLNGRVPAHLPPLDLSQGTEFQQAVWLAMAAIPVGHTKSYGEIAQTIGRPKANRAVGQACGANPIPVLIPCHRVLAANRKIGGFSAGLDWKHRLLAREGVELRAQAV
jgi:O-6-methylguanine DNA methyltransferase